MNRRDFLLSTSGHLLAPKLYEGQEKSTPSTVAGDTVFADFESGNYNGWTLVGDAFGNAPATDAMFPGKISGFVGHGFACSLHPQKGNAATGKLISHEFTIEKPYITFKIGGGNHPGQACINLVVDTKNVRSATGNGTPVLAETSWDVSALLGKKAHIEIVDATISDNRGYILLDDIHFTDRNPAFPAIDFTNLLYQGMVTQMADRWRHDYGMPGVWCAFIKDGRVQAIVANGYRNIETKDAADIKDHLPVGSISKVITGSLIAFFVAEGVVKYETTIRQVFPELARQHPNSPLLNATLRNLTTHAAGLPRGPDVSFDTSGPEYRLNALKKYLEDERCKVPGTVGEYSNQGTPIAVAMVEKLSGTTFESWVYGSRGKRIGLSDPHQVNSHPNESFPHVLENGVARVDKLQIIKPRAFAPQGAYSLTLSDLCAFAQFTLTNSAGLPEQIYRRSIIGPTSGLPATYVSTNGMVGPNHPRTDAGWGFNDGMRYLIHDGQIDGHYAELWVSPGMNRALAFYTNCVEQDKSYMRGITKDIYTLRFMK